MRNVNDLVLEYPSAGRVYRTVNDVSFTIERGSTFAVVGESGCGKSTVVRSLVRLIKPTSGSTPMLFDPSRAAIPPQPSALGRNLGPAEVAGLTAFLLGAEVRSITGQQLGIRGGASL